MNAVSNADMVVAERIVVNISAFILFLLSLVIIYFLRIGLFYRGCPRYVMDYIGIEPGKKSSRVIHVIGWIIEIFCAVFLEKVFERMIEQIIR